MDIGAFMQTFTGEPIASGKSAIAGIERGIDAWQGAADTAAGHGQPSFHQTVRQCMAQADDQNQAADEDIRIGRQLPDDVSELMLLLETLGQGGTIENPSNHRTAQDTAPADAEPDLLAMIDAQLTELENALAVGSHQVTGAGADLLAELNTKMEALAASIDESVDIIDADTLKALQHSLSQLQIAMGQGLDPTQAPALPQQIELTGSGMEVHRMASQRPLLPDNRGTTEGLTGEKSALEPQDQTPDMVDPAAADEDRTDAGAGSRASSEPATPPINANPSKRGVIAIDGEKDASAKTGSGASDGRIDNGKPALQNSIVQVNATSPPQPEASTPAALSKAAAPLQDQDEPLSAKEKLSATHGRQHLPTENEAARSTGTDRADTQAGFQESIKAVASEVRFDKAASPSLATPTPVATASGDSGLQKSVMDQIVEKATFRSANDRSEMRIQLKPDVLGDVRMRVVAERNQLVVQMIADKAETKEIIESQIHHLKAELDKQGLTVGKIEVMINPGNDQQDSRGQFFHMFKNGSDGNGKRQPGDRHDAPAHGKPMDEKEPDSTRDGINYFA